MAVLLVLLLFIPTLALADGEGADVVSTDRVLIEDGEEADNVVVLFNDVYIDGWVHDSVFVIMGDAEMGEKAKVDGRLMVIGGDITAPDDFKTGRGMYHINLKDEGLNEFLLSVLGFAGLEFAKLFLICLLMTASVIVGLAFPNWTGRASDKLLNAGRAVGLGIVLFLILITAVLILAFTVVGIPVAVFLTILTVVLMVLGFSVASLTAGRSLLERMGYDARGFAVPLTGTFILSALSGIPVIGVILLMIFSIAGMGAIAENLIKI